MKRRMGLIAGFALFVSMFDATALGVSCGTAEPDIRFNAVCGLAPRDRVYNENWFPTGSGTLVRWTDSQQVERLGIVTVRHFLDQNGSSGQCVQPDLWYAYFRPCVDPPPWPPPSFLCAENPCPDDEVVVVRVTCFTLASGAFFGGDCVLVGEIEEEDLECIAHITPMTVASPYSLGLCRDQPVYFAGWGKTLDSNCDLVAARSLHAAATTIAGINCDIEGRGGAIMRAPGSCVVNGACLPQSLEHDSGGAVAVELQDGSLCLVGVIQGGNGETLIAVRHQFFEDPDSSDLLCQPCRPKGCIDITGRFGVPDGYEDSLDRDVLEQLGPRTVSCRCPGDLNGNGCAGDAGDLALMSEHVSARECTVNVGCHGDADLDGLVDSNDLAFIDAILDANNYQAMACPACSSCPPTSVWCKGDVDCDGDVDLDDYDEVQQLLNTHGPFTCLPNGAAPGCSYSPGCP